MGRKEGPGQGSGWRKLVEKGRDWTGEGAESSMGASQTSVGILDLAVRAMGSCCSTVIGSDVI